MEHCSLLPLLIILQIGVILGPRTVTAFTFPTQRGSRPTVHPDTTPNPWDTTTYPWDTTTYPWDTTPNPWVTTPNPWDTTTYPWNTTPNPWDTTTGPWNTTPNPWDTTRDPWYSTTRPWDTTTRPWYSTTRPWDTTTRPWYNTTTPYPTEGCPQGWVDSIEGCFLFYFNKRLSRDRAQYECERLGGFLAEPRTQQQVDMLKSLAFLEDTFVGVETWWIGLTDQGHEGRWIWQHDTETVYNTDWVPGSPHHGVNNLDCAIIQKRDQYRWRDTDCTDRMAAPICQREQTGPTPTTTWRPYTSTWRPHTSTWRPHTSTWRPYTTTRRPYTTTWWLNK